MVQEQVSGFYDDLFVETCGDWVVPYIGDLVGSTTLYEAVVGRRADVAHTIGYRRRKGMLPMLERLARDVTGWDVHVVPAFELLGWTQNDDHVRRAEPLALTLGGSRRHPGPSAWARLTCATATRWTASAGRSSDSAHGRRAPPRARRGPLRNPQRTRVPLAAGGVPTPAKRRGAGGSHRSEALDLLVARRPHAAVHRRRPVADTPGIAGEHNVPAPGRERWRSPRHPRTGTARTRASSSTAWTRRSVMCKDLSSLVGSACGQRRDRREARPASCSARACRRTTSHDVSYRYGFSARLGGGPYPRERRRDLPPGCAPTARRTWIRWRTRTVTAR